MKMNDFSLNKTISLGTLVFVLGSLGCAVGPDYKVPEIALESSFAGAKDSLYTELESEQRWWASFNDPLLDELISEAVLNNKDVLQALARINESRALRRQAISELLPGAQFAGDYEKSKSSGARFPGGSQGGFEYEVYTGSIDALWEIDIFGRLRRDLEAKNAGYQGSVAKLEDALRMLIAEIATSYFELRGSQAELNIARKNSKIQEETLELVKEKVLVGQVGELDSARAEAQLEATRATVSPLEFVVKQNIHRLSVLLGKKPTELYEKLTPVLPVPEYKGPINISNPAEMLRRRPDLRVAERTLAEQTALIGVATGDLYPKLELSGSLGVEAADFSNLTNGAGTYRFGPSLTWAPLDTGRLRARVRAQDARTEGALYAYEQAVLLALEDVENSLARFSAEKLRLVNLRNAFAAAQRAHGLAKDQYQEGVTDFLSVLDSQKVMLDNESNLIRGEKSIAVSLVGVYKALGGGWENWKLGSVEK